MSLKILFLTQCDDDGAGKANVNIAKGFIELGHEVQMLVAKKNTSYNFVTEVIRPRNKITVYNIFPKIFKRIRFFLQKWKVFNEHKRFDDKYCFYNENEHISAYHFENILKFIKSEPDVIIAAWISFFINYDTLGRLADKFNARPFLLMNDMANITGGCHYAWDCNEYKNSCKNCPAIIDKKFSKNAFQNLQNKLNSIIKYNIKIVSASNATKGEAKSSYLFKHQKEISSINGLIDFSIFNNHNRSVAKSYFGFKNDRLLLFAGATYLNDPRKGFDRLHKALVILDKKLQKNSMQINLLLLGSNNIISGNYTNIEFLHKEFTADVNEYALLHQAADIYVSPSLVDSGPSMVIHALASGTPVIGFEIGFVKDFVKDGINGYVVKNFSVEDLANKLYQLILRDYSINIENNCINSVKYSFSINHLDDFLKNEKLI